MLRAPSASATGCRRRYDGVGTAARALSASFAHQTIAPHRQTSAAPRQEAAPQATKLLG
jgi:hypothetical protein